MEQLQELLVEELRDIYDAEKQLVRGLPKMAKASSNAELKQAFAQHLEVTKNQVTRVEKVLELLGQKLRSKPCKAMKGLMEEAQEHLQEHEKGELLDQVLIASAQKVEHYEIASYGTVRAIAKSMGNREAMGLLQETLKEEEQTDKLLTTIALKLQREYGRTKPATMSAHNGAGNGRGTAKRRVASSASSSGANGTRVLSDPQEIQQWAEERGAKPACVRGTGKKGDLGVLRLDFPGYTGADKLQAISWDDFFDKFQERKLQLLVQDKTAGGKKSNFNKLVSKQTAAATSGGNGGKGRPAAHR
jgi:ferritin-like metal-binding protein YciE